MTGRRRTSDSNPARRVPGGVQFFGVVAAVLTAGAAWAQPPSAAAPEGWPCVQRYQPEISSGTFWPHELPGNVDRGAAPQAWELADRVTGRVVTLAQARTQTRAFLAAQDEAAQALQRTAGLLVAALHELTNRKRDSVIAGIARFSARQQLMIRRIEEQAKKIETLRADDPPDFEALEDLQARQTWDVRVFEEREALVDHLCEQPVLMEQKLFAVGRDIAAYLEEHGGSR